MIKKEDLQIGDWVYIHHNGSATHFAKVTAIYESGTISVELEEAGCLCRAESLQPIPLTPEILEKNGFVEKNVFADTLGIEIFGNEEWNCGVCSDDEDSWLVETYKTWTRCYEDGSPYDWGFLSPNRICGIKYVHQLQRALRLLEIQKDIEL